MPRSSGNGQLTVTGEQVNAALVRVACQQFTAETTLTPAVTPEGQPVESVQTATVALITGARQSRLASAALLVYCVCNTARRSNP